MENRNVHECRFIAKQPIRRDTSQGLNLEKKRQSGKAEKKLSRSHRLFLFSVSYVMNE